MTMVGRLVARNKEQGSKTPAANAMFDWTDILASQTATSQSRSRITHKTTSIVRAISTYSCRAVGCGMHIMQGKQQTVTRTAICQKSPTILVL